MRLEQSRQKRHPQFRQWCLRRPIQKFVLHLHEKKLDIKIKNNEIIAGKFIKVHELQISSTYFMQAATAWSGIHKVGLASFSSTASQVELASEQAPVEEEPEFTAALVCLLASISTERSSSPARLELDDDFCRNRATRVDCKSRRSA